jgi:GT2 family glycosyltransferase
MISVVIPVRNSRQLIANCLASLLFTFRQLGGETDVEYILIDDHSDPEHGIIDLFKDFRRQTTSPVKIARFKERRHYAWGCAYGFASAKGSSVLFLSHDMCLTPDYVRTITQVAALDESFGIVRGTSQYVDCFPQYQFVPPLPTRGLDDLANFAAYIAKYHGLAHSQDILLTGDAMLIKRSLFQKIGTFDTRFPFGYFADIDFGLRTLRAGFQMVCAKGAWLHHEGAGAYKDEAATKKIDMNIVHAERMKKVQACYESFIQKWDKNMPPQYTSVHNLELARLRALPQVSFNEFQPMVSLDDPLAELI